MENNLDLLSINNEPVSTFQQKPADILKSFTDIPAFRGKEASTAPDISDIYAVAKSGQQQPFLTKESRPISTQYDTIFGKLKPKYEAYLPGIDNDEFWAQRQSWGDKVANGLSKAGLKTLKNIGGGTIGFVNGAFNLMKEGELNAFSDNKFNDWLDEVDSYLENALPNRLTQEYQNRNFLQKLTKADFWAGEVGDAFAFMAGAIGSELIWGAATGGSSWALSAAKWGSKGMRGLGKVGKAADAVTTKKLVKELARQTAGQSKLAGAANNVRFMATSSGFEAGVEARASFDENIQEFQQLIYEKEGRMPTFEEYQEYIPNAIEASNSVFKTNVAILSISNAAQFGKLLGWKKLTDTGTGINRWINKKAFGKGVEIGKDGVASVYQSSKFQRTLGKTYDWFKNPIVEGWEEGSQGVASRYFGGNLMSMYDPDSAYTNLSGIQAFGHSLYEGFLTKEGFNEVGIGMLIGKLGGVFRGGVKGLVAEIKPGTEYEAEMKAIQEQVDAYNQYRGGLDKATRDAINRFAILNQQIAAATDGHRALENGESSTAATHFSASSFFKMYADNSMGMLDEGFKDFKKQLELIDDKSISEDYGISIDKVQEFKQKLVDQYQEQMKDFQDAISFVEAFEPNSDIAGLKQKHFEQELAFNYFMGLRSLERINDLGETIEKELGENGMADQLAYFNSLDRERKNLGAKLRTRNRRIDILQEEYAALQMEFSALNDQSKRREDNIELTRKIEANRKRAEKVLAEKTKLEGEKTQIQNRIDQSPKRQGFIFGDVFNKEGITQTPDSAVEMLEKLDDYLDTLEKTDPQKKAALELLLTEYKKTLHTANKLNDVLNTLTDPRYNTDKYKGVAKFLNRKYSDKQKTEDSEETRKAIDALIENTKEIDEYEAFFIHSINNLIDSVEGYDELPDDVKSTMSMNEEVSNEDFIKFKKTGEVSNDIVNNIAQKIVDGSPLTTREKEIQKGKVAGERITERVKQIKKERGDALRKQERQAQKVTPIEGRTQIEVIRQLIQDILDRKSVYLKNLVTNDENLTPESFDETKLPSEKEYRRYNKLKEQENLSPRQQKEYDVLEDKIKNWAQIEGTQTGRYNLEDLYMQLFELEKSEQQDTENDLPEGAEQEDTQPTEESISGEEENKLSKSKAAYDILQTYDKVVFSRTKESSLNIHNLSVGGLLQLIEKYIPIASVQINEEFLEGEIPKTEDIKDVRIELENGEVVKIKMGERGRLMLKPESEAALTNNTGISFGIVHKGRPMTMYSVVFQEIANESVALQSVLEGEDAKPNVFEIQKLKKGDELEVFVNLEDEYNKDLIARYKAKKITKQELTRKLKLSFKSGEETVGYLKQDIAAEKESEAQKYTQALRKKAAAKVLENTEVSEVETGITEAVKHVYIGHPHVKVVNNEIVLSEIQEHQKDKVADIGYIHDGKVVVKNGAEDVELSFVKRIIKDKNGRYQGKRVPIIVLNFAGKKVAYPVTQKGLINENASQQLEEINQKDIPLADKVIEIYKFLRENKIDPNTIDLRADNYSQTKIEQLKDLLATHMQYESIKGLVESDMSAQEIAAQNFLLNIDLDTDMFYSPKVVLDFPTKKENTKKEEIEEEDFEGEYTPPKRASTKKTTDKKGRAGDDIEAKKADIERRRQESNENQLNEIGSNRFLKLNKEGENTELSEVELKLINSLIDKRISQGKSSKEINAELISRGFIQSQATTPAQIETYLQSRIDGKINAKVGESISQEINAKYDAELASLEGRKTQEQIEQEEVAKEKEALIRGGAKKRREAGFFVKDGIRYDRQKPNNNRPKGNKGKVKFAEGVYVDFQYELAEADEVQPSHKGKGLNQLHFIPEAQPKNRTKKDSTTQQKLIADKPLLSEVGESPTAYDGAPVINKRGEVIQGNNRSIGLKQHYSESGEVYKKQLLQDAEKYGFTKEQVEAMKNPIMVRMVDTSDNKSIELGNYDRKDVETGTSGRIDAENMAMRLSDNQKERLISVIIDELGNTATVNDIIRARKKAIYDALYDTLSISQRDALSQQDPTKEIINDIEELFQKIAFPTYSYEFKTALGKIPINSQKAVLRAAIELLKAPSYKSVIRELQNAVMGYSELLGKGHTKMSQWLYQTQMGESLPTDTYTDLEIEMVRLLLESGKIENFTKPFKEFVDKVVDKEANLLEPAREGISKEQAVEEVFGKQYEETSKIDDETTDTTEYTAEYITEENNVIDAKTKAIKISQDGTRVEQATIELSNGETIVLDNNTSNKFPSGLKIFNLSLNIAEDVVDLQPNMETQEMTGYTSGGIKKLSGVDVEIGSPVSIRVLKNSEKAPDMGSRFGQDVEPSGNYVIQQETSFKPDGWLTGIISFNNPLVIDVTDDTIVEWKRDLSKQHGNLAGKNLTDKLKSLGYDGIITRIDNDLGEIIAFDNSEQVFDSRDSNITIPSEIENKAKDEQEKKCDGNTMSNNKR